MKNRYLPVFAGGLLQLAALQSSALEAHVHGIAELHVVLEGTQLDIELHSPAVNLLGFEHHANTKQEQETVDQARRLLADSEKIFQFAPSVCTAISETADFSDEPEHHEEHDAKGEHEEHHHGDIVVHYQFNCSSPEKLQRLSTTLQKQFPGIHTMEVQWIVSGRQGAVTLDNKQQHVYFR
jgi:hypothetical protein